ncbi:type III secretion system effector phosphothreonine lyase, partial [Shigella sonnei]
MPIKKPCLKLNLDSLNVVRSEIPQMLSANERLKNNFNILYNQIRQYPAYYFKVASNVPNYSDICQFFSVMYQGFQIVNHSGDVFIHACRENPQSKGDFVGDKFHISIAREQVPLAFQILSGLLFSEDSPIDKWKITDMNRVSQQSRVGIGAQFTLYVKSDQECSQYSALLLHKIRQFIMCLESNLLRSKIAPGEYPASDVRPEDWKYVSYRNELRSDRDGSERQEQMLREEPFY